MRWIGWTLAGAVIGVIAIVTVALSRRPGRTDLGEVSGNWLAEHRATSDPNL